ncbi:MAG: phasin family protein [Burkholderiaceae bacterium]|nr:phasin family protein [Burkholderiaceae bacterium]
MMTPEQFAQFQQQQLHALHELTLKYVSSIQLLTELHLQHTKNSLEAHSQHHQELLQVKSLQELVQLQSKSLQPVTEKLTDYTHHLYNIFLGLGQEVTRLFDVQQTQAKPQEKAQVAPTTLPAPKTKTASTKSGAGQRGPSA